ncbi:flagellar type III secretion system pore protein FliP [Paludibaculum fermentans]|uniref:flagellar type III secretion system pore protein FliP n=1 Tax=Paludibaculum fermentans TaxID=1473598 RepID=UPI003EB952C0
MKACLIGMLAVPLSAAPSGSAGAFPGGLKSGEALTVPLQILVMMTALTVLPALLVSVTPFLRITVVLHFLRQALGTQTIPSNQVVVGLALFLSLLLMRPVLVEVYQTGWLPLEQGQVTRAEAWENGSKPLKKFLIRFVREKDIALLLEITKTPPPRSASELDLGVLAPAYVLSELKTGFQIGAVLFLPFLIIDIVIASVTLSIGMVQLPPVMVSAPFKILLFVLVDGWNLVVGSLMRSFS